MSVPMRPLVLGAAGDALRTLFGLSLKDGDFLRIGSLYSNGHWQAFQIA